MSGPSPNITLIKDLKPGMRDLNLHAIALDIGRPNTIKDNQEVRTVKIADRSGMVNLSLWNEPGKILQPGDILRVTRAYTGVFKACLTVYTTKVGEFFKIGEFCMLFSEAPFMSEPNQEMAAQFEKDEAERKALKADFRNGQQTGTGGKGQFRSQASSNTGSIGNKTWGTQASAPGPPSRGGGTSQGSGRGHHRGASKEKR
jgi:hypothetical protein